MMNKSYHVVANPDGGWNVLKGGSERASKHFETQKDAIQYAREVSKRQQSDLFIHKQDGTIRRKTSNSHDLKSPRDRR